jgi:hypothetical protein
MKIGNVEAVKQLKPFAGVEVHISIEAKTARLVLVVRGWEGNHPSKDFPLDYEQTDVHQVGGEVIAAAKLTGLMDESTPFVIVDVDALSKSAV